MLSWWFFFANGLLIKPLFGILSILEGDTSFFFEAVVHSANDLVIHNQVLWARWYDHRYRRLCIFTHIQEANHRLYYHVVHDSCIGSKVTAEIGKKCGRQSFPAGTYYLLDSLQSSLTEHTTSSHHFSGNPHEAGVPKSLRRTHHLPTRHG